ncbi:hypothetical protein PCANC_01042 [Puccinia coronata f. sp. avenae]|uniref:RNA-directed DNA polymerase n=1 Tax=Puccinia coronata f. sp. avenae TaxID=200324 RepID=A0A2N5W6N5_9BASI|nr:hypothetical protein PCANC_01042 [Puccinia coronata f. sp. avenae]
MADAGVDPPREKMVKIKPQDKALKFSGPEIEQFLDDYELAAELDGASDYDKARQIGAFVETGETRTILATLDGYKPPVWSKLKESMLSYWVDVDKALFTERDISSLVESWVKKSGVSSVSDYHAFRKAWEPIQAYLVSKGHIDSAEELKKPFYQAFSEGFQGRIRDQLIKDGTLIVTADNRARLPAFKILRDAVDTVMKGQISLTFEDTRSSAPVASPFQAANDVMKKMGEDQRPKAVDASSKPEPSMDELAQMFKAFEQYMKKEQQAPVSTERPPIVCYYCHRERHGTARCMELQKDKDEGLVEQRGSNFFLPNGALIPFDRSRPIRHVVASYQPATSAGSPRPPTPTRQFTNVAAADYKASCGSLQPWYPPAVSSQSFAGAYEAEPAGRKRHEEARLYKAPLAPSTQSKRPLRRTPGAPVGPGKDKAAEEPELFDRIMNDADPEPTPLSEAPIRAATPPRATGSQPKVRFERDVSRDHPDAVDGVIKRIFDLPLTATVAEMCSISPAVADGVKKWVSRRRVEIGSEELKVNSGTLAEGVGPEGDFDPNLYSCPLGYLKCSVGEGEAISSPLVDSGSQLNLISDSLANKLSLTPRVNFSSAVYGINNQACELIGVAEDVPIRVGRSIVGSCHFWITRADGPFILGRPFLMDFKATLMFSSFAGERIILPDSSGRNIEVTLCPVDKGRWEREFPAHGRKALLLDSVKKNQNQKQPENQKSIKNSVSTPFRPQRFSHSQSFACGFSTSSFQEQQLDKRTQDLAGTQARAQAKESRIPRRLEGLKVSPLQLCTSGLDATSISKTLPCATVVSLEEPLVSPTFSGGLASRQETPQEEQEQFSFHRKKASAPLGEPFNSSQVCRRHSACSDPSFQDQGSMSFGLASLVYPENKGRADVEENGATRRWGEQKVSSSQSCTSELDTTLSKALHATAVSLPRNFSSLASLDTTAILDSLLRNERKLCSHQVVCEGGMVEFGPSWRAFGVKVSSSQCAPPRRDASMLSKTLSCATIVSDPQPSPLSFADKAAFEDQEEHRTSLLLRVGLGTQAQASLVEAWKAGGYLALAAKYKPVARKIRPVNVPMPQGLNPPLRRPPLSRDPYQGLARSLVGPFSPKGRVTQERLSVVNFGPDGWLSPDELNLIKNILAERNEAIAFNEGERGLLKESYGLPYIIPVVEHEPWQKRKIPIPAAKLEEYTTLIRERVRTGLYEQSTSSYSSPVFCVLKSNGKLRIVHDLQPLNKVTVKDAGVPPATEEFVESFSGRACYGLGDIMGGYDERALDPISRPLTTFDTPLGRFQLTRLPQGATNSVAVYQAQMMWILQEEIPDHAGIFIDDGGIKGPVSDYNNESLPWHSGIRRFIWEYAETLERVLFRIEESGLTVSASKLAACVPALEIVGHVVCKEGRRMAKSKVNKILSWPTPINATEVRGFLGVVVYVRIFIPSLSQICLPLRRLTRKDTDFVWTADCEEAFKELKSIVGRDIVLVKISYGPEAGLIRLAVDSSFHAVGAVLTQRDENGWDRPALYESLLFSDVESRYSQPKLELCGVARILKKLQTILWGQHFELQVDAQSLIQMINTPSLPNAPMTRWVAFIQLFSFDIVHCPGRTFTMPDGLSRRPQADEDSDPPSSVFDEDSSHVRPLHTFQSSVDSVYHGYQEGFWRQLEEYLTTLARPRGLNAKAYQALRRKATDFFVQAGRLMRRGSPLPRIVVTLPAKQDEILSKLHEDLGHRGVAETYRRVADRFWWPSLKQVVIRWCQSCKACQKRDGKRPLEPRYPTGEETVFGRVSMDAVHIKAGGAKYLIVARDDFSGWVEAKFLNNLTSEAVAAFLQDYWTMRYGLARSYSTDGGSEFGGALADMLRALPGKHRVSTPYYPEGQGMVERGHGPLKAALVKLAGESGKNCRKFLPLVLFADRISTKRTTGYSPYELVFGQRAALPIDLDIESFLGVDWEEVRDTTDLLIARSKQLE